MTTDDQESSMASSGLVVYDLCPKSAVCENFMISKVDVYLL